MMESTEMFDTLEGFLKSTDEIDLIVLRGHLILEQCLNGLLAQWIESEQLPKLNLTFGKKVDLDEALQDSQGRRWADEIVHLRELNRIRNKLAHQLPSKYGQHANVKKWACSVIGYTPKTIDRRLTCRRVVLKALYLLTGYLSGAASMAKTIKEDETKRPNRREQNTARTKARSDWRPPKMDAHADCPPAPVVAGLSAPCARRVDTPTFSRARGCTSGDRI
jgi:hypothetical protein